MPAHLRVAIDPVRISENTAAVRALVGPDRTVYAVVKADGYGLGTTTAARAALDGGADGFYVFDLAEARAADLKQYGKPILAVDHPWHGYTPADYRDARVRPIVSALPRAAELTGLDAVLSIDTGMRRFALDPTDLKAALDAGRISEVMCHAVDPAQVQLLLDLTAGLPVRRHAAATALLSEPSAFLDAVRPGLALYRGALRVSATVVEARATDGPPALAHGRAGYTQFTAPRVGVILAGYSQGVRPGTCLVRGQRRRIYEVGMQSCYVELLQGEGPGEEVVLLGTQNSSTAPSTLTESDLATAWSISPQEVLVRLGRNRAK